MKEIVSTLTLLTWLTVSYAQGNYNYGEAFFECGMVPYQNVTVDSLNSVESGIWQIAHPQKSVINSSALGSSILLTDSVSSYPVSDSSRFYVYVLEDGGLTYGHTFSISGSYWSNTDSINDYTTVELLLPHNPEYGWINLLEDSLPNEFSQMQPIEYYFSWDNGEPVFTGNSNGWKSFSTNLIGLRNVENFWIDWQDTLTFRFTFHSDAVFDSLDGMGFDDLSFCNYVEGLDELQSDWLKISPNPSLNEFTVNVEGVTQWYYNYDIFDILGKRVKSGAISSEYPICTTSELQSGVYQFVLINQEGKIEGMKKIIKQ